MTSDEQSPSSSLSNFLSLIILVVILLLLLAGVGAGLLRLDWQLGIASEHYLSQHGPLMLSGLLASVIAAERAMALSIFDPRPRSQLRGLLRYLIPLLGVSGSLMLLWPGQARLGLWVITASSLGLLALMLYILDISPGLYTLLMAIGAAGWAFGNLLWLGGMDYPTLLPTWAVFVILTIAGERFALLHVHPTNRPMLGAFYAGSGLVIASALLTPLNTNLAVRGSGLGALISAYWLLKFDAARSNARMTGLSRFSAWMVLAGFIWLGLYGLIALRVGYIPTGSIQDALTHSLLIGFAIGMLMANSPFQFPAVLGRKTVYHPWMLSLAIGFHLTLALRILSDVTQWHAGWQWGSLLNTAFGLLFISLLIYCLWTTRHAE